MLSGSRWPEPSTCRPRWTSTGRGEKLKAGELITGQDLDERRTALESAEARVSLALAQVSQAEAQLAEAQRHLQKSKVTALIEGVVSERKVDVGDFLDKATPLFTLVDNRILDFTANVPATDLPLVAEGQALTFTVDGMAGQSFNGSVKRVNPMVNANDRTGHILAEVQNHEGVLRGGLDCTRGDSIWWRRSPMRSC
jgi:membrane fusion protein, multidrug efflux system